MGAATGRAGLESLHLIPFGAAAAADVDAIMTAHILVPGLAGSPLDPDQRYRDLPATLNPAVLDRLLRRHLGFDGIIVTDAREMWAIRGRWEVGEAAVMALEAGAPAGFDPAAHRALLDQHRERAASIARQAVCLVEPFEPLCPGARLLVITPLQEGLTPADTTGGQPVTLPEELTKLGYLVQAVTPSPEVTGAERAAVLAAARRPHDRVVFGTINAWRFPRQAALFREVLGLGRPVIGVALRDPYDLPLLAGAAGRLATCSTEPVMMAALAAVLAGRAAPHGRLPVAIP